ncbi:MAG: hypothetical protein Q7R95_04825 [bacterium]|nr:hypothetical protein [bacterium]
MLSTKVKVLIAIGAVLVVGTVVTIIIVKSKKKGSNTGGGRTTTGGNNAPVPTKEDYIKMADMLISWTNLYIYGAKLGLDKAKVDAIVRSYRTAGDEATTNAIKDSLTAKFGDWITLIGTELTIKGVPLSEKESKIFGI